MKKNIIRYFFLLTVILQLAACEKNERMLFDDEFGALQVHKDSSTVNFMFLHDTVKIHPVSIHLILTGQSKSYNRKFKVELDKDRTTAIEGEEFGNLQDEYILPKDAYGTDLIINVKKTDLLKGKVVEIALKLKESEDFREGIFNDQEYKIKILNNLIEPPHFWGRQNIERRGGKYHPIKCKKFIEIAGITEEKWEPENNIELLIYSKRTRLWFEENPTYDESGNRILFEAD